MKKLLYIAPAAPRGIIFLSLIFQPPIKSFEGMLSTLPREIRLRKFLFLFFIIYFYLTGFNLYAQQWHVYTHSNSGLPDNGVGCIAIDTNGNKWIGTANGLAKFDGINWTVYDTSNSPIPFAVVSNISIDKFNNLWVGSPSGGGLVKFDGVNWTIYNISNSGIPSNQVLCLAIDGNNVKWIGAGNKLVKYNDTTWVIYSMTYFGLPTNNGIYTMTIRNNIKWFGATHNGIIKYFDTGYIIYNTGNSQIPSDYCNQIFVQQNGMLWTATDFGGLGKFNTISNQWTAYNSQNSGIENFLQSVIVSRNNIKWIGAATTGLVRYNDTIFTQFNTSNSPLPDNTVGYIIIDSVNNLWIATNGGLAEFNENGIIGIENNGSNVPKNFILFQNYPNPFNPGTVIGYQLSVSSYVNLKVFDVTGKELAELVNKKQNIGKYEINFNAENLPSGIYFYTLKTESYSETKKMLMVK